MARTGFRIRELALLGISLALAGGCTTDYDDDDSHFDSVFATYSPSTAELPVPNDLLYSQTTDGTLNIPVADPADINDPQVALNSLDGWSTVAPFTIPFSGPVDASTALPGSTVRIFEVTTLVTPTAPVGGPVTGVTSELTAADFSVIAAPEDASGATLRVLWNAPLAPATSYMVVLTNGLQDLNGRRLFPDSQYQLAASKNAYPPGHPFQALQMLVDPMLDAATTQGVERDKVIVSYTFTTQGIADVLATTFAIANGNETAVIAGLCAQIPAGCADQSNNPFSPATLSIDTPAVGTTGTFFGVGSTDVYVGGLQLPYYLDAASNPSFSAPIIDFSPTTGFWRARYPFVPGDTDLNLTRFNPLPLAQSAERIPVLLSMPAGAAPPAGWPIAIFLHGITRNRTDMLLLADSLAGQGLACIAIDLPLHGLPPSSTLPTLDLLFEGFLNNTRRERTFGLDLVDNATGEPGSDGIIDPSGQHYLNLQSLMTGRDNLRQSVTDAFNLAATIGSIDVFDNASGAVGSDGTADFDPDLRLVGQALGSIIGTTFLSFEARISSAALSVPGGGIAKLLNASESFGPELRANLAAAGILPDTPEFESFLFAAQTVLDSADPISYAAALQAAGLPLYANEVIGGGPGGGQPDAVVPNSVPDAPLSGTDPLVAVLGLPQVNMTSVDPAGLRALVRYIEGIHSSLINPGSSPAELAAFMEMQTEVTDFAQSNGTSLLVNDNTVIQ